MAARPADWQCPNQECVNHHKMVFGSKSSCPKCGTPNDQAYDAEATPFSTGTFGKPAHVGGAGGQNTQDWPCPNDDCLNHTKLVFAKHSSCPSCGTAKNAKKAGDWQCPNTGCANHRNTVFASKFSCPRCGMQKPQTRHDARRNPVVPMQQMMQQRIMQNFVQHRFPPAPMGGKGQGRGAYASPMVPMQMMQMMQPMHGGNHGDWKCPNQTCINNRKMVFAKHESCPQCGTSKMQAVGKGMGGSNPADWQCPNGECINSKNKVFAKHDNCPSCGTPNPDDESNGSARVRDNRSRSPYGLRA